MNQGLIPRRYAKALFLVARERACDVQVYDAMRRLVDAYNANVGLDRAIGNPAIDVADKRNLVAASACASGPAEALLADFVKLLDRNRRLELIREIALAYVDVYRREHKIFSVVITAPQPLEANEVQRIHSLVERHLPASATAEFDHQINPDLIGGFTVSIDNELLDASVASELKQLRLKLLSL